MKRIKVISKISKGREVSHEYFSKEGNSWRYSPVNLEEIQDSEIIFENTELLPKLNFNPSEYGAEVGRINMLGKWSNFYREATDHIGNILGKHQVKSIKLKVTKTNE